MLPPVKVQPFRIQETAVTPFSIVVPTDQSVIPSVLICNIFHTVFECPNFPIFMFTILKIQTKWRRVETISEIKQ